MSEMIPTIPALGILFDARKIESGGYGIESWKIFWHSINGKHLFAKLFLFEGDLAENTNIFCIAVQAFDQDVLNKIKNIIEESNEYKRVSSNPNFIEDSKVIRELLPSAGIIEPNGNFIPNGFNSNAAFKKVVMPEVQKVLCNKCGSHNFDYDRYWKEYSCKKCGWIVEDTEKISVLNKMRNSK